MWSQRAYVEYSLQRRASLIALVAYVFGDELALYSGRIKATKELEPTARPPSPGRRGVVTV